VIENNTDEDMNGTFELYYDNNSDQRIRIDGWTLSIGKKSSGNNKSTNITFTKPSDMKEDGKYMLVFRGKLGSEEDAVAGRSIELKDREYLFLVSDHGNSTVAFQIDIVNNQYQLTPVSKDLNILIERKSFNLTIQSSPTETEHYVSLPVQYRDSIPQYGLFRYYATDWLGYKHYASSGSPYCYRPKDFLEGSPYILGAETTEAVEVEGREGIFASGRHNYTLDTIGKMTSYWNSIWRKYISGYVPQYFFRYKEKISGEWIDGSILAVDEPLPYPSSGWVLKHTPIAFVGRNKALIISTRSTNGEDTISDLKLGTVLLHTTPQSTHYDKMPAFINPDDPWWDGEEYGCQSLSRWGDSWEESGTPPGDLIASGPGSYGHSSFVITVHDYDNMNDDDTFSCFFSEVNSKRDTTYEESLYNDGGFCYEDYSNGSDNYYGTTKYYFAYRYNGSTVLKIELSTLTSVLKNYLNPTLYPTLSGTRISGQSSQINDRNIVYTYIVEKPERVDDKDTWVFVKRIIGIINISDKSLPIGHRQEFELDFSGTDFDPKSLAAIGVTR
jgi:hypothetical protein